MTQPKDHAPGWDPFKTDPLYQQLEQPEPPADYIKESSYSSNQGTDECSDYPATHRRPERPFGKPAPKFPELSHPEVSMWRRLFEFLVPLDDPWRIGIGFAVFFLMVNAMAGRGWFAVVGLSPYASAASVTEIKMGLIEGQIFDTIKAHCQAPTQESKTFYSRRKWELLRNYEQAAGRPYTPVPTCSDLGIREVI